MNDRPRIYEVDVGGARYWIGAKSLRSVCIYVWTVFHGEGSTDDVESDGSMSIEVVPTARAETIMIQDENGPGGEAVKRKATEILESSPAYPMLIGCSEY